MAKSLLVTGGRGFIAGSVLAQGGDWEVHAVTRGAPLESRPWLTWHTAEPGVPGAMEKLFDLVQPRAVIHTAAMAAIDQCEAEQEAAEHVNVGMTRTLLQLADKHGARFVFLSTDNVFNGERGRYTEEDPPSPINHYGATKAMAEKAVAAMVEDAVIARVSVCLGLPMMGAGNAFLTRMIPKLEAGEELGVPPEEIRSPIDVVTLGQALLELAAHPYTGILHVSGNDIVNRFEMVQRIAVKLGYPAGQVVPNDPTTIPGRAPRPRDVSLSNAKAREVLKTSFCGLEEGIARVMDKQ